MGFKISDKYEEDIPITIWYEMLSVLKSRSDKTYKQFVIITENITNAKFDEREIIGIKKK